MMNRSLQSGGLKRDGVQFAHTSAHLSGTARDLDIHAPLHEWMNADPREAACSLLCRRNHALGYRFILVQCGHFRLDLMFRIHQSVFNRQFRHSTFEDLSLKVVERQVAVMEFQPRKIGASLELHSPSALAFRYRTTRHVLTIRPSF